MSDPPERHAVVKRGVKRGTVPCQSRHGKRGVAHFSFLTPVRPRVLWEDGGNSKGLNKMAEMEDVKL